MKKKKKFKLDLIPHYHIFFHYTDLRFNGLNFSLSQRERGESFHWHWVDWPELVRSK